jgi:Cu-Zn family superoxide dismutase
MRLSPRLRHAALPLLAALALPLALTACDPVDNVGALTLGTALLSPPDTTTGVTGTIVLTLGLDDDDPVRIDVDVEGLTPGEHGLHIHEGTSCARGNTDADAHLEVAGAAGGHHNPLDSPHGPPDADADDKHWGDLGNVTADASGVVRQTLLNYDFDQDDFEVGDDDYLAGQAVIIHSGRDDYATQPDGASGVRIGCGLLAIPPQG